ncbi:membrane protein required for colicin V production [Fontimonas thermophila]|uniref:Membrane protein required for colicin V production n=1 Tax=Fontimonas thermophila TaxID=1076937 RepID=A0A1I2HQ63_9GAMM|nr:CvpA family protein [Fontimonas thermophila]SFF31470.1 membrane protein required for colicin V production [Fontimonas thermophila]
MSWVDYCILFIFIVSVFLGIWRGFTREVFSLLTWIAAFVAAWLLGPSLSPHLQPWLGDSVLCDAMAYAATFFIALFLGALVTHFLVVAVRDSRFSPADRTLGGGLGLIRAVIVVTLFVLVAGRMGAGEDRWWQQSTLIPHFAPLARGFEALIPERWLELLKPTVTPSSSPGQ